jgi:CheY-like chemotaxis protein
MTRKVVKLMLEKIGFEVVATENGKEAEDLYFQNSDFCCLLLDYEMPVQNGLITARNVRKAGRKVPIIILTAHSTDKDRQDCLESGADHFLTKPITLNDLRNVLLSL